MNVKLRVIFAKVRSQLYCMQTCTGHSGGETGEGLKDEPIIFQFFPRESSQQRAQCPGLLGVGSRSPPSVLQTSVSHSIQHQ